MLTKNLGESPTFLWMVRNQQCYWNVDNNVYMALQYILSFQIWNGAQSLKTGENAANWAWTDSWRKIVQRGIILAVVVTHSQ